MASGTLGQSAPSAVTNTTVYTVPASKVATFNVNMVNRSQQFPCTVRLAICASSSPANSEYIEYETTIQPNEVLERTGLVATAAKLVVVYVSLANVSVNVYGFEEAA
jgi:hypothetical protein